ncbi:MAG: hypothetical protein M3R15_19905 [Acidobacteriota bacterium]|nr:hypothetical protein [Acidobacteriota bacterium]
MQTNNVVKIIKRSERESRQGESRAKEQVVNAREKAQGTTRGAVMTITDWISELRQKKNAEAAAACSFKRSSPEAA